MFDLKNRKIKTLIRVIAAALVVCSLAYDIAWAYPDPAGTNHAEGDKLAPSSFFKDKRNSVRYIASTIATIEQHLSTQFANSSITFPALRKSFDNFFRHDGKFDKKAFGDVVERYESLPGEILIRFVHDKNNIDKDPHTYLVRYCTPEVAEKGLPRGMELVQYNDDIDYPQKCYFVKQILRTGGKNLVPAEDILPLPPPALQDAPESKGEPFDIAASAVFSAALADIVWQWMGFSGRNTGVLQAGFANSIGIFAAIFIIAWVVKRYWSGRNRAGIAPGTGLGSAPEPSPASPGSRNFIEFLDRILAALDNEPDIGIIRDLGNPDFLIRSKALTAVSSINDTARLYRLKETLDAIVEVLDGHPDISSPIEHSIVGSFQKASSDIRGKSEPSGKLPEDALSKLSPDERVLVVNTLMMVRYLGHAAFEDMNMNNTYMAVRGAVSLAESGTCGNDVRDNPRFKEVYREFSDLNGAVRSKIFSYDGNRNLPLTVADVSKLKEAGEAFEALEAFLVKNKAAIYEIFQEIDRREKSNFSPRLKQLLEMISTRNKFIHTQVLTDAVDIKELFTATLTPSNTRNLKTDVTYKAKDGLVISGSGHLLLIAVETLVENADKTYQERGATNASAKTHGKIAVTAARSGDAITISVKDSAGGLDPEVSDPNDIFKLGFSTRGRNGGLGLALAKAIVEQHGGTITVRNNPGKGVEFVMSLPIAVKSEPTAGNEPQSGFVGAMSEKIGDGSGRNPKPVTGVNPNLSPKALTLQKKDEAIKSLEKHFNPAEARIIYDEVKAFFELKRLDGKFDEAAFDRTIANLKPGSLKTILHHPWYYVGLPLFIICTFPFVGYVVATFFSSLGVTPALQAFIIAFLSFAVFEGIIATSFIYDVAFEKPALLFPRSNTLFVKPDLYESDLRYWIAKELGDSHFKRPEIREAFFTLLESRKAGWVPSSDGKIKGFMESTFRRGDVRVSLANITDEMLVELKDADSKFRGKHIGEYLALLSFSRTADWELAGKLALQAMFILDKDDSMKAEQALDEAQKYLHIPSREVRYRTIDLRGGSNGVHRGRGEIMRGDSKELARELGRQGDLPDVSTKLNIQKFLIKIEDRIRKGKRVLDKHEYEGISAALESLPKDKDLASIFRVFSAVVMSAKEKGMPQWLLGFNSLNEPSAADNDAEADFARLLYSNDEYEKYRGIIALSDKVIDAISSLREDNVDEDIIDSVIEEYIFHEIFCQYMGHENARAIQEVLYKDNYKNVEGDKRKGHKDGYLTLALKRVIDNELGLPEEAPFYTAVQAEGPPNALAGWFTRGDPKPFRFSKRLYNALPVAFIFMLAVIALNIILELYAKDTILYKYRLLALTVPILIGVVTEIVNDGIAQYISNRTKYLPRQTFLYATSLGVFVWLQYGVLISLVEWLIPISGISGFWVSITAKSALLVGVSFLFAVEYMLLQLSTYGFKEQLVKAGRLFTIGGLGLFYFLTNFAFYSLRDTGSISLTAFIILLVARAVPSDLYTYSVSNSKIVNLKITDFIKNLLNVPSGIAKDRSVRAKQYAILDPFGRIYKLKLYDETGAKTVTLELNPESVGGEASTIVYDIYCEGRFVGYVVVELDGEFKVVSHKIVIHKRERKDMPFVYPFVKRWLEGQKGKRINITNSLLEYVATKKMIPKEPFFIAHPLVMGALGNGRMARIDREKHSAPSKEENRVLISHLTSEPIADIILDHGYYGKIKRFGGKFVREKEDVGVPDCYKWWKAFLKKDKMAVALAFRVPGSWTAKCPLPYFESLSRDTKTDSLPEDLRRRIAESGDEELRVKFDPSSRFSEDVRSGNIGHIGPEYLDVATTLRYNCAIYGKGFLDTAIGKRLAAMLVQKRNDSPISPPRVPETLSDGFIQKGSNEDVSHPESATDGIVGAMSEEVHARTKSIERLKALIPSLTSESWKGRTALIDLGGGFKQAMKFNRAGQKAESLHYEARKMREYLSQGMDAPMPLMISGSGFVFEIDEVIPSAPPEVDRDYKAMSYVAKDAYFKYPEDAVSAEAMRECAMNSMTDLAKIVINGDIHRSLARLSHGDRKDQLWLWNYEPLGALRNVRSNLLYSNLRFSGVGDFEHVTALGPNDYLYYELGRMISEWMLIITYHSIRNGIDKEDITGILADSLDMFAAKLGADFSVERPAIRHYLDLFENDIKDDALSPVDEGRAGTLNELSSIIKKALDALSETEIYKYLENRSLSVRYVRGKPVPEVKLSKTAGGSRYAVNGVNRCIEKTDMKTGISEKIAEGAFIDPRDIAISKDAIYVAEGYKQKNCIVKITQKDGSYSHESIARGSLPNPSAMVLDGNILYVTDLDKHCIVRIDLLTGSYEDIAVGSVMKPVAITKEGKALYVFDDERKITVEILPGEAGPRSDTRKQISINDLELKWVDSTHLTELFRAEKDGKTYFVKVAKYRDRNELLKAEQKKLKTFENKGIRGVPHVVRYGYCDEWHKESGPHGLAYIIMDHIDGEELQALDKDTVREDIINIARQAAVRLRDVNRTGIVHRDVKPMNFLYDKNSRVVSLMDFNLSTKAAKYKGDKEIYGTPQFVMVQNPLLIREIEFGTTVKRDINGFGCTLLHMLAGAELYDQIWAIYSEGLSWGDALNMEDFIRRNVAANPRMIDIIIKCLKCEYYNFDRVLDDIDDLEGFIQNGMYAAFDSRQLANGERKSSDLGEKLSPALYRIAERVEKVSRDELKEYPEVISIIKMVRDAYGLYGFNGIVNGKEDYSLGRHDTGERRIYLATDLIKEMQNNGPPSLSDEYILYGILFPTFGKDKAMKILKKIYPEHYAVNKDNGLLGIYLRAYINFRMAKEHIKGVWMLFGTFFMLYSLNLFCNTILPPVQIGLGITLGGFVAGIVADRLIRYKHFLPEYKGGGDISRPASVPDVVAGTMSEKITGKGADIPDHATVRQNAVYGIEKPFQFTLEAHSFLYRHPHQFELFGRKILPLLVERHNADKKLRLVSIGSATGEEVATLLGVIIQEFEKNTSWGNVEDWDIQIYSMDKNGSYVEEAKKRLSGNAPLAMLKIANSESLEKIWPDYMEKANAILSAINRHDPRWVEKCRVIYEGDAASEHELEAMAGRDAIFMNMVFGGLSEEERGRISESFRINNTDSFLLGTTFAEGVHLPIEDVASTHKLVRHVMPRPSVKDFEYTVAVPQWAVTSTEGIDEAPEERPDGIAGAMSEEVQGALKAITGTFNTLDDIEVTALLEHAEGFAVREIHYEIPLITGPPAHIDATLVRYERYSDIGKMLKRKGIATAFHLNLPDKNFIFVENELPRMEEPEAVDNQMLQIFWNGELSSRQDEIGRDFGMTVGRAANILAWSHQIALNDWRHLALSDTMRSQFDRLIGDEYNLRKIANEYSSGSRAGHTALIARYLPLRLDIKNLNVIYAFEASVAGVAQDNLRRVEEKRRTKPALNTQFLFDNIGDALNYYSFLLSASSVENDETRIIEVPHHDMAIAIKGNERVVIFDVSTDERGHKKYRLAAVARVSLKDKVITSKRIDTFIKGKSYMQKAIVSLLESNAITEWISDSAVSISARDMFRRMRVEDSGIVDVTFENDKRYHVKLRVISSPDGIAGAMSEKKIKFDSRLEEMLSVIKSFQAENPGLYPMSGLVTSAGQTVPSFPENIAQVFQNTGLGGRKAFADLGCGDGRAVFIARLLGVKRCVGYDLNDTKILSCLALKNKLLENGFDEVRDVEFYSKDYLAEDLGQFDTFYHYTNGSDVKSLEVKLKEEAPFRALLIDNRIGPAFSDNSLALQSAYSLKGERYEVFVKITPRKKDAEKTAEVAEGVSPHAQPPDGIAGAMSERMSGFTYDPELRRQNVWDIARNGDSIPVFVSDQHVSSYGVVAECVSKGLINPERAFVVNFDHHSDMISGARYPDSSNWIRLLYERKFISNHLWVRDGMDIDEFRLSSIFEGKEIIVSVDIDYFNLMNEEDRETAIRAIYGFVNNWRLNIRAITIAYSPSFCKNIDYKRVASRLTDVLGARFIPDGVSYPRIEYVSDYGVIDKLMTSSNAPNALSDRLTPREKYYVDLMRWVRKDISDNPRKRIEGGASISCIGHAIELAYYLNKEGVPARVMASREYRDHFWVEIRGEHILDAAPERGGPGRKAIAVSIGLDDVVLLGKNNMTEEGLAAYGNALDIGNEPLYRTMLFGTTRFLKEREYSGKAPEYPHMPPEPSPNSDGIAGAMSEKAQSDRVAPQGTSPSMRSEASTDRQVSDGASIRKAHTEDAEDIARLHRLLWPDATSDVAMPLIASRFKDLIAHPIEVNSPTNYLWVYQDASGRVIGYIHTVYHRDRGSVTLEEIAVDKNMQRHGIGTALTSYAINYFRGFSNLTEIMANANEVSSSILEGLGFRPIESFTGRRKTYRLSLELNGGVYSSAQTPDSIAGAMSEEVSERLYHAKLFSKERTNYIFFDADNFLWQGTHDLVPRIYGEIFWRARNGIDIDDARMPRDEDLAEGIRFFKETTHLPQADHFPALMGRFEAEGIKLVNTEEEYIGLFERRIEENFRKYVDLIEGAKRFLDILAQKKRDGYDVRMYILSHASQFEVDAVSKHLGIDRYFNGIYGSAWGSHMFNKADKIKELTRSARDAFVAMGGDSPGDMVAAREAGAVGFAATTGTADEKALIESGAAIVRPELGADILLFFETGRVTDENISPHVQTPSSIAGAMSEETERKELLINEADRRYKAGLATNPFTKGQKILISESLFDEIDKDNLKRILGSDKFVEIVPFDVIKHISINAGGTSKENLGYVVTRDELKTLCADSNFKNNPNNRAATVLALDENLTGENYLYLEGVVGLVKARMDKDFASARVYMRFLFKDILIDNVAVSDDALERFLKDNDSVEFALHTILKFKPIEKFKTDEEAFKYKLMVENALMAA